MRLVLLVLFSLLAGPVTATPLLGDWTCRESHPDGGMISYVSFLENGRFKATMHVTYRGDPTPLIEAQVRYRSRYEVREGRLHDRPTSVRMQRFTIDGVPVTDHPARSGLLRTLRKEDDTPVAMFFDGPDRMTLQRDKGAPISCARSQREHPSS